MSLQKSTFSSLKIKDLDDLDKPREKLINLGASNLSNAELIAILIRSGTQRCSAIDLAKYILYKYKSNLNILSKTSIPELKRIKGIGEAKALSIIGALELSKRLYLTPSLKDPVLNNSKAVYEYIKLDLFNLFNEQLWVIFLAKNNKPIKKDKISMGGLSEVIVDPKIIFKKALSYNSPKIILIHNHPSGELTPSQADIDITKKLMYGASILDLQLVDHLIYTNNGYFSFADSGYLS